MNQSCSTYISVFPVFYSKTASIRETTRKGKLKIEQFKVNISYKLFNSQLHLPDSQKNDLVPEELNFSQTKVMLLLLYTKTPDGFPTTFDYKIKKHIEHK